MTYNEDIKIVKTIPRCPGCGRHSHYMAVNKKTGEVKYFCEVCGAIHLMELKDNGWEVIKI